MAIEYIAYASICFIYLDISSTSYFEGKKRKCVQEGAMGICYFVVTCANLWS